MLSLLSYTFMVSALLAARFGFASPIEKRGMIILGGNNLACYLTLNPAAVDAETFDNLKLFGQFAAAAYCPSNNDDGNGGKKVTCPPGPSQNSGNCPLVEADNVTTVLEFQK